MRILRGAGPAGLAAMPVNRGRILRPLLSMNRTDVLNYLAEKNIPWREDATNTEEIFLRNKIRRRLIPLLDECFPSWKKGLTGMAETQSLAAAYISEEAQKLIVWEHETDGFVTSAERFFAQPQILREEALFQGVNLLISRSPKRSVIRQFCSGAVNAVDLGRVRVRQEGGKVLLTPVRKDFSESGFSLLIKEAGLYTLVFRI